MEDGEEALLVKDAKDQNVQWEEIKWATSLVFLTLWKPAFSQSW